MRPDGQGDHGVREARVLGQGIGLKLNIYSVPSDFSKPSVCVFSFSVLEASEQDQRLHSLSHCRTAFWGLS